MGIHLQSKHKYRNVFGEANQKLHNQWEFIRKANICTEMILVI